MKRFTSIIAIIMILGFLAASAALSAEIKQNQVKNYNDYKEVIQKTVSMVADGRAREIASKYGLQILNVTWEDTGRYKNSAVGPNISDMTIQVQQQDPQTEQYQLYCMPVIRFPNFSDKTCDVRPEKFYLLVGNEKGKKLRRITLKQFLDHPRFYLSNPRSWKGTGQSLLAQRDSHVLVSAQACFLPIPKGGNAQFNPVLFNYQSYKQNPAVLTILATREGTSVTIIDNTRDGFQAGRSWGQRLFFNQRGQRASLTGKRLSDFKADKKMQANRKGQNAPTKKAAEEGLNMVLLIQVPLKHKSFNESPCCAMAGSAPKGCMEECAKDKSDVENAVIGHGKVEGPFTEIDNLAIERDERYPIRVTIQFYKATSNGVISHQDMASIAKQINKVYSDADYVGSLVVGGETNRPTEYTGSKVQPPGWWNGFWNQYEDQMGISREEAWRLLQKTYGPQWQPRNSKELRKYLENLPRTKKLQ